MRKHINQVSFKDVYPLYLSKVMKKGRHEEELLFLIHWMTGYSNEDIKSNTHTFELFFNEAPHIHEDIHTIKGKICGVDIESIEDPIYKYIRQLDKLVDELAKGKSIEKIIHKS
jgi:hypothetical protein